jgi:hypothetical protein
MASGTGMPFARVTAESDFERPAVVVDHLLGEGLELGGHSLLQREARRLDLEIAALRSARHELAVGLGQARRDRRRRQRFACGRRRTQGRLGIAADRLVSAGVVGPAARQRQAEDEQGCYFHR